MLTCTAREALQIEPTSDKPVMLGLIRLRDYAPSAHVIHLCPAESTELVRKVFYLALDIQDSTIPNYNNIFTSVNYLMFAAIISAGHAAKSAHPMVLSVISEILEHFSDPAYDVRVSIKKTGYSVNHFRKIFHKEIGVSPTEFLTNKRIDRAIELFRKSNELTIKEVALQCGFEDPYYFSRVFNIAQASSH